MSHKIRLGILGGGGDSLIGGVHRIASNMFDRYQIVGGCFNPNPPWMVASTLFKTPKIPKKSCHDHCKGNWINQNNTRLSPY